MKNKDKKKDGDDEEVEDATSPITAKTSTLSTIGLIDSTTLVTQSNGVTQPIKTSNAGLIAGATIVGAIFLLVASIVIYMCCCRCKKDYPRKNSTYQMYSEVDASHVIVPGHLRTINSPIYGKEEHSLNNINENNAYLSIEDQNQSQPGHEYEEISHTSVTDQNQQITDDGPVYHVLEKENG